MTLIAKRDGVRGEHVVVAFVETAADVAELSFDNGIGRLDLRSDPDLDALLDARFTSPVPSIWTIGHHTHVKYPRGSRLLRRMLPAEMRINPRVPWSIRIHGGAVHLTADLTGVDARSIAFNAGAAHVDLTLGRPAGPRTIQLGSTTDLTMRRPGGIPVRIEIADGASQVALDGRNFGAVGRGFADQSHGYDTSEDRYLVTIAGGASQISISALREPR